MSGLRTFLPFTETTNCRLTCWPIDDQVLSTCVVINFTVVEQRIAKPLGPYLRLQSGARAVSSSAIGQVFQTSSLPTFHNPTFVEFLEKCGINRCRLMLSLGAFMKVIQTLKVAVLAICLASGSAIASTVNFVVDGAGSSASASRTGCIFCFSDISATTASGLGSVAFELGVGETSSWFDFVEFTAVGIGGGTYDVSATLAFSSPGGSASSDGDGIYGTLLGAISGGSLNWDTPVQQVAFGNGGFFTVQFEEGITIVHGDSAIARARVIYDVAQVPLPASALFLIAGLGGLAAMRMRKKST